MSNEVTITITVRLPDGVVPDVSYADTVPEEPPHFAEFAPITAVAQAVRESAPLCQFHGAMKRYPAGVSQKSGKSFNASWRCDANGCTTKPLWDRDAA